MLFEGNGSDAGLQRHAQDYIDLPAQGTLCTFAIDAQ